MTTQSEKRDQLCGAHLTRSEKKYVRILAAEEGQTTSTFIRQILTDVLSKIEDESNPFSHAQNKQ
ncbi:hypothetical protein [Acinetobacter bereziniae]|uniref:hypothetical protein n=1 Tax=Acinetobacter bereziniae TaxID=106648 RepID=UPI002576CC23|nr:hypothetical protein [Acinetobacter bereziniae]MDM1784242.1 hypothetical protein [Acinetobacter bereziniae]